MAVGCRASRPVHVGAARLTVISIALASLTLSAFVAPQAPARPLVLLNASVIDVRAGSVTTGSVVVRDGRIAAVGAATDLPANAQILDVSGRFVMPGLWDMHAHLAALTAIGRAPEHYVGHGVLHVRDMGGFLDQLAPLREEIRAGRRIGPQIVMAGPTLNSEQFAPFQRKVTTAAEARAAVRELKAAGVDLIKIHRATNREVFDAVADETRRVGLPFAGHVPLVVSWVEASRAGMRTIEHIQTIFENLQPDLRLSPERFEALAAQLEGAEGDRIFAELKKNGTYFDPTLIAYEASIEGGSPEAAALRRLAYQRMQAIAGKAAASGVAIVAGTDVLERHGEMLLQEVERLVRIGLSPQRALAAATATAAEAAGRPELGTIAAGSPAFFLVLDRNPLLDVANLRSLSAVVRRGEVLDAEALRRLRQ